MVGSHGRKKRKVIPMTRNCACAAMIFSHRYDLGNHRFPRSHSDDCLLPKIKIEVVIGMIPLDWTSIRCCCFGFIFISVDVSVVFLWSKNFCVGKQQAVWRVMQTGDADAAFAKVIADAESSMTRSLDHFRSCEATII